MQRNRERARRRFRIIPLLGDGATPKVLEGLLPRTIKHFDVVAKEWGVDDAVALLLPALGLEGPENNLDVMSPDPGPLEELLLESTQPSFTEIDGMRRANTVAKLIYQPADRAQCNVESDPFVFTAPLGPLELTDVRWYLGEYAFWPLPYIDERARRVEARFAAWGEAPYRQVTPKDSTHQVWSAWARSHSQGWSAVFGASRSTPTQGQW